MKKFFALSITAMFMLGVLFPATAPDRGKSPFVEQIKKIFHYSDGVSGTEGTDKSPALKGEGKSGLFQEIRNVFHYFPGDKKRPGVKKYPSKFEKNLKKEMRYPARETK